MQGLPRQWPLVLAGGRAVNSEIPSLVPRSMEEPHFAPTYWARKWGLSVKVIQRWFRHEAGVLKCKGISGKRTQLRIPPSVAEKVYRERTA